MTQLQSGRRYDIDTLRVLAFVILILYHTGMYYVADWGWHVKSTHQSVWLQDLMLLVNQWRMCLLFMLSGMALALVNNKYSAGSLIWLRSKRLLIPLVFSMYVIVAPQLYYQLQFNQGYQQSYLTFWLQYINPPADFFPEHQSSIGLLTWNHLWYLPYLWVYTCIMLLIGGGLKKFASCSALSKVQLWHLIVVLVTIQTILWMTLGQRFPDTHNLIQDWYAHSKYLLALIVGFMLVYQQLWWRHCIEHRKPLLILAICGYAFIFLDHHDWMPTLVDLSNFPLIRQTFYSAVYFINRYAWLFAVLGYGGYYLNRRFKWLNYANEAILPWYILHQTLIILAAMALQSAHLPIGLEAVLILIITVCGCYLGYELVKRFWLGRLLFGLKLQSKPINTHKVTSINATT
ncbi:acyltransferase family protein [Neptunicella sp.]|uniref:acyltransferase family protein n=1 Tax=Neptunicella sp. TaxID=2125986 RepID=UPI003F6906E9